METKKKTKHYFGKNFRSNHKKKSADEAAAAALRDSVRETTTSARKLAEKASREVQRTLKNTVRQSEKKQQEKKVAKDPRQRRQKASGPKLRIIPLGGLGEIGKNMTVFEYGNDMFVVDCGTTFPDGELLGVDLVIPDMSYLVKNRDKIRGIVITHAHEDHIGALPYFLREIKAPIYCTALTAGMISTKLSEHRNLGKIKINVKRPGDHIQLGCFDLELIRINHSIADAVAYAIRTPVGTVVMTGDFKIDVTPIRGEMIDLERFGRLGREGVLLLMSDSTNAERPGFSMSERRVGQIFDAYFKNCDRRIIVATFASNVDRVQQIISAAAKYGRKVAVSGRSMENIVKVAMELGYLQIPDGTLVELNQIGNYPMDQQVVITTGSQGEPMSALHRMAFTGHRQVEIGNNDRIILSSSPIPGNEKSISGMINELIKKGAEVIYSAIAEVHVSGHACQEELKMILALTKPKFFMPVHGEARHLQAHGNLAKICGVPADHIILGAIGNVVELDGETCTMTQTVPSGRVLVDGLGVGDVGAAVLRERKLLSEDGIIIAEAVLNRDMTAILSGPDIMSRGFIYTKEADVLNEGMRKVVRTSLEACIADRKLRDRNTIKNRIRQDLGDYLFKQIKRSPMVLPIITEV
ncbi:MAG: ribonuclease J [Clostridia bacterium]|nr:ribonuclease J [Clostridia bacterium]MBQ3092261.1 ribonuclease J [Clostridia bacterium]